MVSKTRCKFIFLFPVLLDFIKLLDGSHYCSLKRLYNMHVSGDKRVCECSFVVDVSDLIW